MPADSLQLPAAEMPERLRLRAERLLADGAALHVDADGAGDLARMETAIDLVEDAVALFAEFDPDL